MEHVLGANPPNSPDFREMETFMGDPVAWGMRLSISQIKKTQNWGSVSEASGSTHSWDLNPSPIEPSAVGLLTAAS